MKKLGRYPIPEHLLDQPSKVRLFLMLIHYSTNRKLIHWWTVRTTVTGMSIGIIISQTLEFLTLVNVLRKDILWNLKMNYLFTSKTNSPLRKPTICIKRKLFFPRKVWDLVKPILVKPTNLFPKVIWINQQQPKITKQVRHCVKPLRSCRTWRPTQSASTSRTFRSMCLKATRSKI